MKITERAVKAAETPLSGSKYVWDGEIPGFGLRVWASGRRSFVLRYGGRGRRRLITLGEWGSLTVHQARQKAQKLRGRILDGADPLSDRDVAVQEKEEATREEEAAISFGDLAALYMERWARPHRGSWQEDERRIATYIVPALGPLRARDLKREHVAVLHAEIGKLAPVEANRVRELVRAIWNKGQDWGHVPEGATNPASFRKGDRFQERSRERYVTAAELPALWSAIGTEPNVYICAALQLYLLVALRKAELLRAQWSDLDLDAQEWSIPVTKSGRPHTVPLSTPAVAILAGLPRLIDNPHIFPGRKRGTHLVDINKAWRRIRRAAGLADIRLHDLRRTVGSWIASSGTSLAIVGQILGHEPGDVKATAIYARLQRSAAREALETHANALMALVSDSEGNP